MFTNDLHWQNWWKFFRGKISTYKLGSIGVITVYSYKIWQFGGSTNWLPKIKSTNIKSLVQYNDTLWSGWQQVGMVSDLTIICIHVKGEWHVTVSTAFYGYFRLHIARLVEAILHWYLSNKPLLSINNCYIVYQELCGQHRCLMWSVDSSISAINQYFCLYW